MWGWSFCIIIGSKTLRQQQERKRSSSLINLPVDFSGRTTLVDDSVLVPSWAIETIADVVAAAGVDFSADGTSSWLSTEVPTLCPGTGGSEVSPRFITPRAEDGLLTGVRKQDHYMTNENLRCSREKSTQVLTIVTFLGPNSSSEGSWVPQ